MFYDALFLHFKRSLLVQPLSDVLILLDITMHLSFQVLAYLSAILCLCNAILTEKDLHTKLFDGYKADVMPRSNISENIPITLDMQILSIESIDEKKQTCTIRAFLEVKWKDKFLSWKPEMYGGLKRINVPTEKIWLPDLALLDTYDSLTDVGQKNGHAVVDYTGDILMWPYKMFTVGCTIKVRYFPFDTQSCVFDFLSWSNPISSLDIRSSRKANRNRYKENGEWVLERLDTKHYLQHYGNDAWTHVIYTIVVQRKWLFYALNIIVPIMCISMLNITCFMLPASSGEKITLCISSYLTLAVFMTMIASTLPESSDEFSTLGWYVGLQLVGSGITIVCTVVSLCFYTRESTDPVPASLRRLCKLCCQTGRVKYNPSAKSKRRTLDERKMSTVSSNVMVSICESDVTWVSASYAFDRFCLCIAVCWHTCLFIALVLGFII